MTFEKLHRHTKSMSILLVEDSSTIRNAMVRMLNNLFAHLVAAEDGQKAFDAYQQHYEEHGKNFDIVITDLEMPNIDGVKLSRMLFDCNPEQEIIAISSSDSAEMLIKLINLGVNKFILKPVKEEQLYQLLNETTQKIFHKRLKRQEEEELLLHNEILQKREAAYLNKLEAFNDVLNESAIVSKTDLQGNITYVNEHFCKVSGYSEEELIGAPHSIVKSGDMKSTFYMKLWHTITAKKSFKVLFKNRNKSGELYYLKSLIKPIVGINGEIREYIAVAHDVTGLMKSLKSAEETRKQKDAFFTNIGHEMRTPLNAMLTLLPLLKKRLKDDTKSMQMFDVLSNSSQELHNLIETILDIQKLKANTLQLEAHSFEPLRTLTECIALYEAKARSKEQEYTSFIDDSLPTSLYGDASRLTQALGAVLDNAVKFTSENGVIQTSSYYDDERGLLVCMVSDTGIGIAPQKQKEIFEMNQSDATATRAFEGAGLGLHVASEIMRLMKGTISVESTLGEGSVFTLEFPLQVP